MSGDRGPSRALDATVVQSPVPDTEPARPRPRASWCVAARYRLLTLLGRGGHGEVWRARDTLSGDDVAIKLLARTLGPAAARVRREIATLRTLRIPGVVRLRDEGVDHGLAFVVMDCVDGVPFPGLAPACPWEALAPVFVALLEAVAGIHAAGVVHRDLKPGNVLVGRDGRPTVLDFGVSYLPTPSEALTPDGQVLGTPAYLAPEQIAGGAVTPRSDLYTLGVMAYEALAGHLPHAHQSPLGLLHARLVERALPLGALRPDLPPAVADVVAHLLAPSPDDRPASAREVLAALRGETPRPARSFPFVGADTALVALESAARAGRSVDLVGPSGAGRSRCLHEVAARLEAAGTRVAWAPSARAPLGSLAGALGLAMASDASLAEVTARAEAELRALLRRGAVLCVDDAERVDRVSAGVIERARAAGAVLRAQLADGWRARADRRDAVYLEPLDEAALRALFDGPDRLLHLREDAARALFAHTGGLHARVVREVTAWTQTGVCRWAGARMAVDRAALNGLLAGAVMRQAPLPATHPATSAPLPPHLEELLLWTLLGWPAANVATLCALADRPRWQVEGELEDLASRGGVALLADGRVEPRRVLSTPEAGGAERVARAHRSLAAVSPPESPERLRHVIAGAVVATHADDIAREAIACAERLAASGQLGAATSVLAESLIAAHAVEAASPAVAEGLLRQWVLVALATHEPHARDRVLYELCRAAPRSATLAQLEALVRAAIAVYAWTPHAMALIDACAAFADPRLERWRQTVRVAAARRASLADEARVVSDAARWATAEGSPAARAACAGWRGWVRYRQKRFGEAARLHGEAAATDPWASGRLAARLNQASALMEAAQLAAAEIAARDGLALARACRATFFEARAEWLARAVAYRRGLAVTADLELVEAAERIDRPDLEALMCLNEAAVAYRAGDVAPARALAGRAAGLFDRIGDRRGIVVARALSLACGEPASPAALVSLRRASAACPDPTFAVQALGLLARAGHGRARDREDVRALAAGVRRGLRSMRLDVLSVAESIALVDAHAPAPRRRRGATAGPRRRS